MVFVERQLELILDFSLMASWKLCLISNPLESQTLGLDQVTIFDDTLWGTPADPLYHHSCSYHVLLRERRGLDTKSCINEYNCCPTPSPMKKWHHRLPSNIPEPIERRSQRRGLNSISGEGKGKPWNPRWGDSHILSFLMSNEHRSHCSEIQQDRVMVAGAGAETMVVMVFHCEFDEKL